MSETTPHADLDLTHIIDPEVRRALRTLHQFVTTTLHRQQLEIDALLEVLLEKHLTSLSEFKRRLVLLQQNTARGERIEKALASAQPPTPPPNAR